MLKHPVRCLLAAALVLPAACGSNSALLGKWEGKSGGKDVSVTFGADGSFTADGGIEELAKVVKSLRLLGDYNQKPGPKYPVTYRVGGSTVEVSGDYIEMLKPIGKTADRLSAEERKAVLPTCAVTYSLADKELTLTGPDGQSVTLRRAG